MKKKVIPYSLVAFLLSLSLHISFYLGAKFSLDLKNINFLNDDLIEVSFVTEPLITPKQIVEQNENEMNGIRPDEDSYWSAKNQRVIKQTKARNAGRFSNLSSPGKTKNNSKLPLLKDLKPDHSWFASEEQEVSGTQTMEARAQTADHLAKVEEGDQTLLNTREFVYYSYYQRIRDRLQNYWEPNLKRNFSRMIQKGRTLASEKNHSTRLLITLNQKGNLIKVQVIEDSGVVDLDEAAIEAFNQAAPFPNPPKGITNPDGTIQIRWDFVVEV